MKLPAVSFTPLLLASTALHMAMGAVLAYLPSGEAVEAETVLYVHLATPPETPRPPMIIMAALPEPPAPEPTPAPAPPPQTPTVDEQTLRELAEEREQLRAELQQARNPENLPALPDPPPPAPPEPDRPRQGNLGTIRQLSMEGFPDNVVSEVMMRYRMNVRMKLVQGGSNQSFLSSASSNSGDTFYADRNSPPGLYQVFELSSAAVAKMSQLEEQSIRERGLVPATTHVKRIKFGIVNKGEGYDLGVLEFEAEAI